MTLPVDANQEQYNDILDSNFDYENWLLNVETSLTYKGNSLNKWVNILALPAITEDMNVAEITELNFKIMGVTETIMTHVSISKCTYLSSKANHSISMQKARREILDNIPSGNKAPSVDALEKMCLDRSNKSWRILMMSEIIFEFWNVQNFKLSAINTRITSLNILKNIESKYGIDG